MTEGAESRTAKGVAVGDGCAAFGGDRFEMYLTMLIPFLFDVPIETSEAILQFRRRSLQRLRELCLSTVVNVCASLNFG